MYIDINKLPIEIQRLIWEYDPTYKEYMTKFIIPRFEWNDLKKSWFFGDRCWYCGMSLWYSREYCKCDGL